MPQNVTWNGVTYPIPLAGELNWASLSNFLIALGTDAAVDQESKQAIRLALSSPVTVNAATDYTVLSNLTVPGAVAVTLPAGVDKQIFVLGDGKGDALTNNITITPNGAETINGAANYVLDHNRSVTMIQYHALTTDWKILVVSLLPGTLTPADFIGVVPPDKGGTGVSNPAAATETRVGNFDLQWTLSAATTLTLPTTGTLITDDSVSVLTNKTYDADGVGNVLSNIDDGNIKVGAAIARDKLASGTASYVVVNDGAGVLSEEQYLAAAQGGTGITSTATFPASGVIVTEAGTETLTNKKYLGGVASATDVSVLSKDTLVNLTALPRIQGAEYYDTTNDQIVYDDGAALIPLSSSALYDPATNTSGIVDGTNGLKGFADGSSSPAGYTGEYVFATAGAGQFGNTVLANTYTDASAMGTITLTPGRWLLGYNVGFQALNVSGGGGLLWFGIAMFDDLAAQVGGTVFSFGRSFGTGDTEIGEACRQVVVSISATRTYHLETRADQAVAISRFYIAGSDVLTGVFTDPSMSSTIWAVRL